MQLHQSSPLTSWPLPCLGTTMTRSAALREQDAPLIWVTSKSELFSSFLSFSLLLFFNKQLQMLLFWCGVCVSTQQYFMELNRRASRPYDNCSYYNSIPGQIMDFFLLHLGNLIFAPSLILISQKNMLLAQFINRIKESFHPISFWI